MITAVVGGQFGSEGKGAVAAALASLYPIHVRVGAANAGHTFYTPLDGSNSLDPQIWEKHVVQQLPCAAYANPNAQLILGPGALISEEILREEIVRNWNWRHERGWAPVKLMIDRRAHVVTPDQIRKEAETDLAERIGSTSTIAREGIGQATADRVMREADTLTAAEVADRFTSWGPYIHVGDTVNLLHLRKGADNILLEGTQGTGLSLTTGFYPFCTSRNTTASGLAADCGLGPGDIDHSIVVMRTFPIRVAGNSGPFYPDSDELTFEELAVEPEKTTVTKLERRVATFSMEQAQDAVRQNWTPNTEVALMFADYLCPSLAGRCDLQSAGELEEVLELMREIQERTGVGTTMVGTGPHSMIHTVKALAEI